MSLMGALHALDDMQQRRRGLAFVVAVYKKYSDDRGGSLAALIAYYAFVSLFPLFLVFVAVLGFVIAGDPAEQQRIIDTTLGQIPLLKDPLAQHALTGSAIGLAVGLVGSLLAGLAVTGAVERAFNDAWGVPLRRRPDFLKRRLRGLLTLVSLGALNIVASAASGFAAASSSGTAANVAAGVGGLLLDVCLFYIAFSLLTSANVSLAELTPGVLSGAVAWAIVQHLGGLWARRLAHEQALYGDFGLVLGLIAVLYLGAQILVYAAELNVVMARRLWPRSLFTPPYTPADRRVVRSAARAQERTAAERITVEFEEGSRDPRDTADDDG